MSNETQTTPTDIMPPAQAAGMTEYPVPEATVTPYPGPMTAADGDSLTVANVQAAVAALTANDGAPASPLLTREEVAEPLLTDDVPPIGPIPADDLLFSMNESQAAHLYIAHGFFGARSHDEVVEQLQAKRDAVPAEPATPVMEGYLSGGGIVVTKDFTPEAGVDVVFDHQRRIDCEADYRASQSSNAPAPEPESPAPEREKVWNIHLQAWV